MKTDDESVGLRPCYFFGVRICGRFVIKDTPGGASFRVRTGDSAPLAYAAALALCVAAAALSLFHGFGYVASAAGMVGVVLVPVTGLRFAEARAVARSTYPRVVRALEIARTSVGAADARATHAPAASGGVTIRVDSREFSASDAPRVVLAVSEELAPTMRKFPKRVRRFRPTLVMRSATYELDIVEGGDEADGQLLADAVAAAIDPHAGRAPKVLWSPAAPPDPTSLGFFLTLAATLFTGWAGSMLAMLAERSNSPDWLAMPGWMASALFLLLVGFQLWSTRLAVHTLADARSRDVKQLRNKVRDINTNHSGSRESKSHRE